jgi:uncharacterized protein
MHGAANPPLVVRPSQIAGSGLFAARDFAAGDTIILVWGKICRKINHTAVDALSFPDWIGVAETVWIDTEGLGRFLNHSCDPNSFLSSYREYEEAGDAIGEYTLLALRDIKAGEEVSMDYSWTECDDRWGMSCSCNASTCRSTIGPVQSLAPTSFQAAEPHLADFFRGKYLRLAGGRPITNSGSS